MTVNDDSKRCLSGQEVDISVVLKGKRQRWVLKGVEKCLLLLKRREPREVSFRRAGQI